MPYFRARTTSRLSILCWLTLFGLTVFPAQAATLLYGSASGTTSFYSYNPSIPGSSNPLFTVTSANTPGFTGTQVNSLAVNTAKPNIVYFSDATYTVGATTGRVYYFDTVTKAGGLLTTVNFGAASGGASPLGGGATFYNGAYYVAVEDIYSPQVGSSKLMKYQVSADGKSVVGTTTVSWGSNVGDFGDIAVDKNGILYGSSTNYGGTAGNTRMFKFDLNNTAAGVSLVSTNQLPNVYQLAFNDSGTLFGTAAGTVYVLSTTTGAIVSTQAGFGYTLSDMATGAQIPEPGGLTALGLAALLLGKRLRKR